jgi:hypothetical protein
MTRKTKIPLDEAPRFAAALGRLTAHWAMVEFELSTLLAALLGVDMARAALLYQTFFCVPQKLELLQRLVRGFVEPGGERSALLALLREAAELEERRDGFVHAAWAVGRGEDSLQQISSSLPRNPQALRRAMREVAVTEVDAVVERMAVLSAELQWFAFGSFSKLRIRSEPAAAAGPGRPAQ